jgi:transposase
VAIGRSLLVIIWHPLADPGTRYIDLGSDFYATRIDPEHKKRGHIRQLEALGYTVTTGPVA